MGDKDDMEKWAEAQRAEVRRLEEHLLGRRSHFDKDDRDWSDDTSSSRGPFERFKTFVDSNFSALSNGFKNFPSHVFELKARMQEERAARREEEVDTWRRWTGSEDSPDHIRMQIERMPKDEKAWARQSAYLLLKESYERNQHVSPTKILDLYRDNEWNFGGLDQFANPMLSFGGACYYKPETVDNLPSTARWGWPATKQRWLSVDWFKRDPYSPVQLESNPGTVEAGFWRAAFEDLLCAALDKPITSGERVGQRMPYGKPQSTYRGPGLDWMLSLQCRGILPPQLPSLYRPVSVFDGFGGVQPPAHPNWLWAVDELHPHVRRDVSLLADEIAIQSGPETEAAPIGSPQAIADLTRPIAWRVPETEQDLYDQMPPYPIPQESWVPEMRGCEACDTEEAELALWDALENKDAATAAKCINAFIRSHGSANVQNLFLSQLHIHMDETKLSPPADWYPVLNEALLLSHLPEQDFWKKEAANPDVMRAGELDTRSIQEKRWRRDLIDRFEKATGQTMAWPFNGLSDGLEYKTDAQREQLVDEAEIQANLKKKPEILNQLTTTHTTSLPDGTVVTKVVLKKSFADGRQEVQESESTSYPRRSEGSSSSGKVASGENEKKQKQKGWFWS